MTGFFEGNEVLWGVAGWLIAAALVCAFFHLLAAAGRSGAVETEQWGGGLASAAATLGRRAMRPDGAVYLFERVPTGGWVDTLVQGGASSPVASEGRVTVDGHLLNPRLDLRNHSPTGLEWGYCGSGPAQAALAVLADYLGDDELALEHYQHFKFQVIAGHREDSWRLTGAEVRAWLEEERGVVLADEGVGRG